MTGREDRILKSQSKRGMGKVIVKIKVTNYSDIVLQRLKLTKRKARQMEVEALVDTGATRLYLNPSVIKGLWPHTDRDRAFPDHQWLGHPLQI